MDHTLSNTAPELRRCPHPVAHDDLVLLLTPTAEAHTRADRTILELQLALSDRVAMAKGVRR